jgi:hypothetical protein
MIFIIVYNCMATTGVAITSAVTLLRYVFYHVSAFLEIRELTFCKT